MNLADLQSYLGNTTATGQSQYTMEYKNIYPC
jgi:hypothetical protein